MQSMQTITVTLCYICLSLLAPPVSSDYEACISTMFIIQKKLAHKASNSTSCPCLVLGMSATLFLLAVVSSSSCLYLNLTHT